MEVKCDFCKEAMKDIVYLTVVDISVKNGQGIYALKTLTSFVSSKDFKVTVICPKPQEFQIIKSLCEKHNFDVVCLREKKKARSVIWHLLTQIQMLFVLLKIGKKNAVVYSLKPMMFAPLIYSRIYDVPVYLLVEGLAENTVDLVTRGLWTKIGKCLLRWNTRCAVKVYPAYVSAEEWVNEIRKKKDSTVIHCGVDEKLFVPPTKQETKQLTIGYVGSFRKVHLLEELIQAAQGLDIKLLLVGDGSQKQRLEQLYSSKKVNSQILFMGAKEQKELPQLYSECDVMWAATDVNHWGVPIKCFEYLACNKKVIYSYKPGLQFIADNKFGYVLETNDARVIKSLIIDIQQEYEKRRLQDNTDSRTYITNNMSWERFATTITEDVSETVR